MMRWLFIWAGRTIKAASDLWSVLQDWIGNVGDLYSYGKNVSMSALDLTPANEWIHPSWLLDRVKSNVTWLLTIQDVLDGKSIGKWWVISDSKEVNWEVVSFNLRTTLKDNRNIIMKAMLELELRWKIWEWEVIKSSYWTVIITPALKKQMIDLGIINEEKYNQSLQILVKFEELQQIPAFIADTIVDGTKLTVNILIDILLLKFLFNVL